MKEISGNDRTFDSLLKQRADAPNSAMLAEQIIVASAAVDQAKVRRVTDWVRDLFPEIMLPRPAYSLTGIMVLGFLLGFLLPIGENTIAEADDATALQVLFLDDETPL